MEFFENLKILNGNKRINYPLAKNKITQLINDNSRYRINQIDFNNYFVIKVNGLKFTEKLILLSNEPFNILVSTAMERSLKIIMETIKSIKIGYTYQDKFVLMFKPEKDDWFSYLNYGGIDSIISSITSLTTIVFNRQINEIYKNDNHTFLFNSNIIHFFNFKSSTEQYLLCKLYLFCEWKIECFRKCVDQLCYFFSSDRQNMFILNKKINEKIKYLESNTDFIKKYKNMYNVSVNFKNGIRYTREVNGNYDCLRKCLIKEFTIF